MVNARNSGRTFVLAFALAAGTLLAPAFAQPGGGGSNRPDDKPESVAELFADFLHFSVLGRFDLANSYAAELLKHPDLDPVEVLRLSEQNSRGLETLVILVDNSTIGDNAAKIIELINEGEHQLRKNVDRIRENIEKLGGQPQTEYNAIRHLVDSGEYAIPWLLHTLRDDQKQELWPRIVRAMPQIGQAGVRPLVQALEMADENDRRIVIESLGAIGYPQAVPYLLALTLDERASQESKQAALAAIDRIERSVGRPFSRSAPDEFVRLAEMYYDEHGSVAADPRLAEANVWYWNDGTEFLDFTPVPREIFGPVMAMRCCERAMRLQADQSEAVALWLAANIRRESRLGMNVESGDPAETGQTDPACPENFPRALYFTSAAGPQFAHMILERAVRNLDVPVALGAVAALQRVAGPSSLLGSEPYKRAFVDALQFPDFVVRVRTALALGNALPRSGFHGVELVIPTLAHAVTLTGRRNILVIDEDDARLNRLMAELRQADTNVIGEANAYAALERAASTFSTVHAIFISSGIKSPDLREAVEAIRSRHELALTPIILMVEADDTALAERIAQAGPGVERVQADTGRDVLLSRLQVLADRVGQTPVDPAFARELALLAVRTLQRIALDGQTVFDPTGALKACVDVLSRDDDELRLASMSVLALLPAAGAQRALAQLALDGQFPEALRLAAFAELSESAKRFANQLESAQVDQLLNFSMDEPNLRLRTAAGHALGALNIAADRASRLPLKFHRG